MDNTEILILSIACGIVAAFVLAKTIINAYFRAKLKYQKKLFEELTEDDERKPLT